MKARIVTCVRRGFYPVFVSACLAAYFWIRGAYPSLHPLFAGSTVLAGAASIVFLLEFVLPYRKEWNRVDREFWSDLVLTNAVFPVIVEGIEIGVRFVFGENGLVPIWPKNLPVLLQLVPALLIAELFFYWTHRLSHEWRPAWHFHKVHHSARRVYGMSAARFHPLDLALNFTLYFLPLALMGAPLEIFGLLFVVNGATGLLEHGNVGFDAGWLNRVFNTAQLHRWHHSVREEISKKNYGKVLSVWDQVFGTYYLPEGGLSGTQVGEVGTRENGVRIGYSGIAAVLRASSAPELARNGLSRLA